MKVITFVGYLIFSALLGFIVLLPGIIVNAIRGRHENSNRKFLVACALDWQTYAISFPVWILFFISLGVLGAFNTSNSPSSRNPTAAQQIRRALPVTSEAAGKTYPGEEADNPYVPYARVAPLPRPPDGLYSVFGISTGDRLNVSAGPSSQYPVVAALPNGFSRLRVVGPTVINGSTEWVKITFGSQTGWVSKQYLEAQ